jgi:hypothetical protein
MSLGKITVSDETCRNILMCICRSLCHQSFAPCKEISYLQDILINWGQFLNLLLHFFGGIAFGTNVFLHCHTDANFRMSISQVFLKGRPVYHTHDDIIAYFCFPTLGVAVLLRPGDYFMFNALIPHCISSRCNLDDEIMCTSVYLKTAIVGMNKNNLQSTHKQLQVANKLYSFKIK